MSKHFDELNAHAKAAGTKGRMEGQHCCSIPEKLPRDCVGLFFLYSAHMCFRRVTNRSHDPLKDDALSL